MFHHIFLSFLFISVAYSTNVCSPGSKVDAAFYNRFKRAAAVFVINDTYFEYDFEQEKLVGTGSVLNAWPNITLPMSFADSIYEYVVILHENLYWSHVCSKTPYNCKLRRTGFHIGVYGSIIANTEAMFIYQENMGVYKPGEKDLQPYSPKGKAGTHYVLRSGKRMDCFRNLTQSNQTQVNVTLNVKSCSEVSKSNLRYESYLKIKSEEHIEDLSASHDKTTNTTDFVIFTTKYMRYTFRGNAKVVPLKRILGCNRSYWIYVGIIFVIIILLAIVGWIWFYTVQLSRIGSQEQITVAH